MLICHILNMYFVCSYGTLDLLRVIGGQLVVLLLQLSPEILFKPRGRLCILRAKLSDVIVRLLTERISFRLVSQMKSFCFLCSLSGTRAPPPVLAREPSPPPLELYQTSPEPPAPFKLFRGERALLRSLVLMGLKLQRHRSGTREARLPCALNSRKLRLQMPLRGALQSSISRRRSST